MGLVLKCINNKEESWTNVTISIEKQKYRAEYGYEALSELIRKYDLDEFKYIQGETKPCYVITDDEINEIYEKEAITLTFAEKLNVVVQRIYQK